MLTHKLDDLLSGIEVRVLDHLIHWLWRAFLSFRSRTNLVISIDSLHLQRINRWLATLGKSHSPT
nr:hypothetical protein [Pseudomonas bharatica]